MKVLSIEDNSDVNSLLETVLTSVGHEFASVTKGRDGVELIKQNAYDIVLLDLGMPEFSGFDVLDVLKKEGLMHKQKIILLTAAAIQDKDLNEMIKAGVHSYLRKPLDIDILIEKIQQTKNSK